MHRWDNFGFALENIGLAVDSLGIAVLFRKHTSLLWTTWICLRKSCIFIRSAWVYIRQTWICIRKTQICFRKELVLLWKNWMLFRNVCLHKVLTQNIGPQVLTQNIGPMGPCGDLSGWSRWSSWHMICQSKSRGSCSPGTTELDVRIHNHMHDRKMAWPWTRCTKIDWSGTRAHMGPIVMAQGPHGPYGAQDPQGPDGTQFADGGPWMAQCTDGALVWMVGTPDGPVPWMAQSSVHGWPSAQMSQNSQISTNLGQISINLCKIQQISSRFHPKSRISRKSWPKSAPKKFQRI